MKKLVVMLWRASLNWRYRFLWKRRHNRLVLEKVLGRPFLVLPEVFNPKLFWTSEVLAGSLDDQLIHRGAEVLDLGTGSGVGAVFAAQWASRVVAVDINPAAVKCARINAMINAFESIIDVRHGDLFVPVQNERFDIVLFNPPFLPGNPVSSIDQAFYSTGLAERFAADLACHLKPKGFALVILSSIGDEAAFLNALRDRGFECHPIGEKALIGEALTVYQIAVSQTLIAAKDSMKSLAKVFVQDEGTGKPTFARLFKSR